MNVIPRLDTEFLSQVQKQREDSAMVLASTQKTGKQRGKIKNKREVHEDERLQFSDTRKKTEEDQVGFKRMPNYKTLHKIIYKTVSAKIPKRNLSLLIKPLVLFKRVFRW